MVYILDPAVDFYRIKSIHGPKISEYFIYRADFTDLHSSQYCSFNNSDSLLCDISYDGNKNARLQQENHIHSLQRSRYDNHCAANEETRQVRHDIRHHYLQLAALAEKGDMEKIKEYLSSADRKMPSFDFHFCDNQAVDSILGYYSNHAKQEGIPFLAQIDIPDNFLGDEMDICLVLSNLLENAIEASLKTEDSRRKIVIKMYLHHTHILLIQAENNFDAKILEKNGVFQSTKHSGNGIGIQSIRHITERNGGASNFTYKDGEFMAKIMLRI